MRQRLAVIIAKSAAAHVLPCYLSPGLSEEYAGTDDLTTNDAETSTWGHASETLKEWTWSWSASRFVLPAMWSEPLDSGRFAAPACGLHKASGCHQLRRP